MKNEKLSNYVIKIRLHDKNGKFLVEIYDNPCSVIIDESILSMLRKISYVLGNIKEFENIDHTMLYIYTLTNYNILCNASLTSANILNEIIDDKSFIVSKHNLNDPIYMHLGYVESVDMYVSSLIEEIDNIKNFYFGKLDERLLINIYHNYIHVYFPIIDLQIYKNLFSNMPRRSHSIDSSYIKKMQQQLLQIESIQSDDVDFLGKSELKNVFLIFIPKFLSDNISSIDSLMTNMIFLDDIFLTMFENVKDVDSVILQTPQIVAQKGNIYKENLHTAPYRITLKGRWNSSSSAKSLPISYTMDFEPKRCRVYLSYNGQLANILTNSNIEEFLSFAVSIFTNDFIKVSYSEYTIDFFNVKVPVKRQISINKISETLKGLDEYFLVTKENKKSIFMKYRVGHMHNVLSSLYTKLFALIGDGNGEISQEKLIQLRIEYQLEQDELLTFVNDVRMKLNSSYRERGISILISDSFVNISGLDSIEMNERIMFVVDRLINISINDKKQAVLKNEKHKIQNEYIQFVTHLDTFLKNKIDVYWCKACQNYAEKIRKPIQYESIPHDFKYDSSTNTFVDKQGHRILTLNIDGQAVHMGCDLRRSNPNKYIGFIKTCSLCCFQEDQFFSKSGMAQRKVASCWKKSNIVSKKEASSSYIYTNAKMIGDVCLISSEFSAYFDDDNYLFKLISVNGSLAIQPRPNELVFVSSQLINPQMYTNDNEEYSVYFYETPFLYKLISRHDRSQDSFKHTQIHDFIVSCRRAFNAFAPLNAYRILKQYTKSIEKFSYLEDMNTCIFISTSGLVMALIDRTLAFGEYKHMFGDKIKYVNVYKIPSLVDIFDEVNDQYEIESILINTDGKVIGLAVYSTFFILFKMCTIDEFHKRTAQKYKNLKSTTNVAIASIVNQEMKLSNINTLITADIAEAYIYKMFRYHLYIYFNLNPNIKKQIFDICSKEPNARKRRELVNIFLFEQVAKKLFIVDNSSELKYSKLEISNNIGQAAIGCKYPGELVQSSCKLRLSTQLQTRMIDSVTNELIFPYSSIYVYTSRFVNNTYSPFATVDNRLYSSYSAASNHVINDQAMRILNDGRLFVQEIYQFDTNGEDVTIYRALANIYFWYMTKQESNLNRRNLGYFSKSQTYLAYYIQSIIRLSSNEIVKLLDEFFNKFKINITLQVDLSVVRNASDNQSEQSCFIYMSLLNGTVANLSVGFELETPTQIDVDA